MYMARYHLPLRDNVADAFPSAMFRAVEKVLSTRFGGVTAHLESPASGLWREEGKTHIGKVVIFEVILDAAERDWLSTYDTRFERDFHQKRILLMLQPVEVI